MARRLIGLHWGLLAVAESGAVSACMAPELAQEPMLRHHFLYPPRSLDLRQVVQLLTVEYLPC